MQIQDTRVKNDLRKAESRADATVTENLAAFPFWAIASDLFGAKTLRYFMSSFPLFLSKPCQTPSVIIHQCCIRGAANME